MKFFIIHGAYGNPEENWFPWLKEKLESKGHTVFVPKFPTPENQSLDNWMGTFEKYLDSLDSETVFIGHSLGPAFILSILEKINIKVKACFFVAGFLGLLGNEEFNTINKTFNNKDFNWNKIKNNCSRFYIIHSEDDPYLPIEKGKELAKKLNSELIKIKNAGHFNKDSGYTSFPKLLNLIKEELK